MKCIAALFLLAGCAFAADKVDDNKALIGTWRGGFPGDKNDRYELVITPEKISGTDVQSKRTLGAGTFKLDTEKHTIDNKGNEGPTNGKNFMGIYELDGDTLKWASNNGNGGRPSELKHKPRESFLMILKRVKETPADAGAKK